MLWKEEKMKLLICYGTRPEYIKVKPLIEYFKGKVNFGTVFIGQHDKWFVGNNVKGSFDFKNSPDHILRIDSGSTINNNRLNSIYAYILTRSTAILENYTHVLVQGDTATVAATAISAFNMGKKVIHLEAGLRTCDLKNPFPEEGYRQMVSRITDLHLCPTDDAAGNLDMEHISGDIAVVGNTVLDNLKGVEASYGDKVLVTMHRRENREYFNFWFQEFNKLAIKNPDVEFVLPLHPSIDKSIKNLVPNVNVVEPMSHESLIEFLKDCRFVITDSGGIQEESSFLKKKAIVCRKTTERAEGLNSFFKLCESPADLDRLFIEFNNNYVIKEPCPFGDGNSAKAIFNEFKKRYSDMCL